MERNWTDKQILDEARQIMTNPALRQCVNCVNYDIAAGYCNQLRKPFTRYQMAGMCRYYETNEEKLLRETRQAAQRLEREERKMNHILTMSLNSIEVAMLFLEDFTARMEKEYRRAERNGTGDPRCRKRDREWTSQLSQAIKRMKQGMEVAQKQYTHFVEPQLNKVFMDKETKEYDVISYDDHMSDAYELARLTMMYFDKAFDNKENADGVFQLLESLQGCGVMEEGDFKRYDFRR